MIRRGARVELQGVPGCRGTFTGVQELRYGSYALVRPDGEKKSLPIPWTDIRELTVLELLAELG